MNEELVQKLVDKCVVKRERYSRTVEVLQSRKFAELIVRECMAVSRKADGLDAEYEAWYLIKEHFGVEE